MFRTGIFVHALRCTQRLQKEVYPGMRHIPMTREEMKARGWDQLDVILITGDAYVDHPSFGVAIIARVLEAKGFKVGVISQPNWKTPDEITRLGKPRLFFGITAGNVDSLVANYTASRKKRKRDDYTPGGFGGKRPDRATIVYSNLVRRVFKDVPIILGGIEASLRRFGHYDWWSNRVRKSVLVDSKVNLIAYGMAEKSIIKIAERLRNTGEIPKDISGTVYWSSKKPGSGIELPSYDEISSDRFSYLQAFKILYRETDPNSGRVIYQKQDTRYVIQNPPALSTTEELDWIYSLPYTREVHPYCLERGYVKALETVKFSITSHRGCYGECNFCALTLHQGKYIVSRSEKSIIKEARRLTKEPDFKGVITDVGGPTANMYGYDCKKKHKYGACKDKRCLHPHVCSVLKVDHSRYLNLLRKLRNLKGVKHVFISSGIRYDLILADRKHGREFLRELVRYHISGQLKIAPEHISPKVLRLMGKPGKDVLERFISEFERVKENKKIYLIGYFIAAHPGSTVGDMKRLEKYVIRKMGYRPQQVQIFTPTPATLSTAMYYTELDPETGEAIFVEKSEKRRKLQKLMVVGMKNREPKET